MDHNLSLYIPHLFENVSKQNIIDTFEFQGLGKVKQIDFVEKLDKKGKIVNSAFIHFEKWYDNVSSKNFQERVKNTQKEARVVYNDPWYWVCMENTTKKCIPGERKMRINLEEFMGTPLCQEEEKNELSVIKPQEEENIQNNYEIAELDYDRMLYQKLEEYLPANRERDANYVRNLEILNYKLACDLYQLQGDFIMV